jgi:hypothetical protein
VPFGHGCGVSGDGPDSTVCVDEQHIERYQGVLHPEVHRLHGFEVEKHALVGRKMPAKHQSALARGSRVGKFDPEMMNAVGRQYVQIYNPESPRSCLAAEGRTECECGQDGSFRALERG